MANPDGLDGIDTLSVEWPDGFDLGPVPGGPRVVCIGGGRGLATMLAAARLYAGAISAIVSVADDGGSSGRLRAQFDVPAPGDIRRAIGALAEEGSLWPAVLEHRFAAGELAGHPVGNLMLVGLIEALGSITAACTEVARIAGAVGSVYPATIDAVTLSADVGGNVVSGQVAIQQAAAHGRVRELHVVPTDAPACPAALGALMEADQIVIGPGSLFTSLVAAVIVPEIRTALALAPGRVVQVANLAAEEPETTGLDGTDHLLAVLEHRVRVDTYLYDRDAGLSVNEAYVFEHGVMPVGAELTSPGFAEHDPERLAKVLADLL